MKHRTLSLAVVGLMASLALSQPALACDGQQHQQTQAPQAQQPDQMVVARDAETGQLRAATAQEIAALQAAKPRALPASAATGVRLAPQLMRHRSGAVGAGVSDEMASYAVVGQRADGSLAEACFESKTAADAAVKAGAVPATRQATEK